MNRSYRGLIYRGPYRVSQIKKYPNMKITTSQKCGDIYVGYLILRMCLEYNCAKVCCFVLYLLVIRQIDGNPNCRNEFCYSTKG